MNRGYIKLWRKIRDNPHLKDPHYLALWIWLLIEANHDERDEILGGKRITCMPGQFTKGRKQLAQISGINESKVERLLNLMESEQQIEQRKTNANRLITILNWKDYQQSEQRNEQQVNNDRTTSEQRVNTLKELKNIRTKEYIRSDSGFSEFWNLYPKKQAKQPALRSWLKLSPDFELQQVILGGVRRHMELEQWKKDGGQYIPHASTWLNQRRWEDELETEVKDENGWDKPFPVSA